jgi:hypothetical protein
MTPLYVFELKGDEIMKMLNAIMCVCAGTLIFSAGEAMAKKKNAKDLCIEKGGIWRAVDGDQISWACSTKAKTIIEDSNIDSKKTIFDRWGNMVVNDRAQK